MEGVVYSDPYLTVPMAAAILLQVGRRQCPVVRHDWGVVRAEGEEDWTGDMAVEEAEGDGPWGSDWEEEAGLEYTVDVDCP